MVARLEFYMGEALIHVVVLTRIQDRRYGIRLNVIFRGTVPLLGKQGQSSKGTVPLLDCPLLELSPASLCLSLKISLKNNK